LLRRKIGTVCRRNSGVHKTLSKNGITDSGQDLDPNLFEANETAGEAFACVL
jgi:hypothetical protein